jgi:hypothetical protein
MLRHIRLFFGTALVAVLALAGSSARGANIVIHRLECFETEDSGNDECALQIFRDRVLVDGQKFDMNNGWVRQMGLRFEAQEQVRLTLTERDSPDPHDWLGTVEIDARVGVTNGEGWFTRDGAQYRVVYSVILRPAEAPIIFTLHLDQLECFVTEDSSVDQCRLDCYSDERLVDQRSSKMRAGNRWDLRDIEFTFSNRALVRLWDEDHDTFGGGHDRLGDLSVPPTVNGAGVATFTRDGASYRLTYRVTAVR